MNLYCHFPFCRRKCAYCALVSRAGTTGDERAAYVARLAGEIAHQVSGAHLETVYFGGGTPALCDLTPVLAAIRAADLAPDCEWTVELHPADVTGSLLEQLAAAGVTRVSLGIQSFSDTKLAAMGRRHTAAAARAAFLQIQRIFPDAGFDLIAGYPGGAEDATALAATLAVLKPAHVSVYSLIREPGTVLDNAVRKGRLTLPDDAAALDELARLAETLSAAGLVRYEISNYARPGCECRHNLAVWRGEDYLGLGDGAHGRLGRVRTIGREGDYDREELSEEADALERTLFSLRTREGLDPEAAVLRYPVLRHRLEAWRKELSFAAEQGLVRRQDTAYVLTSRGAEVCDAILETLV